MGRRREPGIPIEGHISFPAAAHVDDAHRIPIESSIDLHAFAPRDVAAVAEDYLEAAHAEGFTEVRLIHGRGRGVQRAHIHAMLARHPLVAGFWDAPESHLGATIVRLRRV